MKSGFPTPSAAWSGSGAQRFERAPVDHKSGGCCDGLQADGPNRNQGAESPLVCFLSLLVLKQMRGRQIAVEATSETNLETRREVTVHGQ